MRDYKIIKYVNNDVSIDVRFDKEKNTYSGFHNKKFVRHISENYSQFSNKLSKLS